eukprot:TRINITY_DN22179_c0_g4_i1.p1 TRINITY_DN22179_c0_g4~~TRINITY_DN22179_c0_g4_i1.p1  ORF type:complete len:1019 (+),score=165.02 TRINITY_DN22179_c0_g4_i1:74-3130(+)
MDGISASARAPRSPNSAGGISSTSSKAVPFYAVAAAPKQAYGASVAYKAPAPAVTSHAQARAAPMQHAAAPAAPFRPAPAAQQHRRAPAAAPAQSRPLAAPAAQAIAAGARELPAPAPAQSKREPGNGRSIANAGLDGRGGADAASDSGAATNAPASAGDRLVGGVAAAAGAGSGTDVNNSHRSAGDTSGVMSSAERSSRDRSAIMAPSEGDTSRLTRLARVLQSPLDRRFLCYLFLIRLSRDRKLGGLLGAALVGALDFLRVALPCALAALCPLVLPTALAVLAAYLLIPLAWLAELMRLLGQPILFVFVAIPEALGRGRLTATLESWLDWRRLIIGLCYYAFLIKLALSYRLVAQIPTLLRSGELGRTVRITIAFALVSVLAAPFALTSQLVVDFVDFLWRPWAQLFIGFSGEPETADVVLDLLIMALSAFRVFQRAVVTRFKIRQRQAASMRSDDVLQWVLEHPFHAELEHGFGSSTAALGMRGVRQTGTALGRAFSTIWSPERAHGLTQKRNTLVKVCKQVAKDERRPIPTILSGTFRREHIWEDSKRFIVSKMPSEFLAPVVTMKFANEPAADYGGVSRDWFDSVARYLNDGANDPVSLLTRCPDGTLMPRPAPSMIANTGENSEHAASDVAAGTLAGVQPPTEQERERLRDFIAIGRFVAFAILRGMPLPLSFSSVACKLLLHMPVGELDVQQIDPEFYRTRVHMVLRPAHPTGIRVGVEAAVIETGRVGRVVRIDTRGSRPHRVALEFDDSEGGSPTAAAGARIKSHQHAARARSESSSSDLEEEWIWYNENELFDMHPETNQSGLEELNEALGEPLTFLSASTPHQPEPMELKPGGRELLVTDANKYEYTQLLCEAYLCGAVRREVQCLLQGFWELLPPALLAEHVGPRELSMLISGLQYIDPEEWKKHTTSTGAEAVTGWFWDVVVEMSQEERAKLLHFATGSSRLPSGGFAVLNPKFKVDVTPGSDSEPLPSAHTCVNQLILHEYCSKEQLKEKLLLALTVGEGFGFV